jgi:hypothetical protein
MSSLQMVSKEYFIKRISDLCLRSGMSGFPKDDVDQQILLKSVALSFGQSNVLSEPEVNEKLKFWINRISQIKGIDHSALRRWLVDGGYLTRNKDGSNYQVAAGQRPQLFDAAVEEVNVAETVAAALEEKERRKRAFMEKAGKA